jgi:hypothetical protein
MIPPTNLAAVRALLANATPGPWHRAPWDDCPDPAYTDRLIAAHTKDGLAFIGEANTDADTNLIAQAPSLLAALADEVEQARATLADPRVARTLKQIRQTEDEAVDFIDASPYRADIVARLSELSDGQPRPYDGGIDRTLLRLGLDCGGPDTIVANTSVARVLARLTSEPTP